jgi:uncharacterized membrane protein YfcA
MDTNHKNNGSLVGGSMLILFGLLALASRFTVGMNLGGNLWPLIIIGVGLMFFVGMFIGGKSAAGFAVPGAIVTTIGVTLLVQNLTGHWESWSYAWTLILMAVGLGFFIAGRYGENEHYRLSGLRILMVGSVMFVIFGAFFGMFFNSFGASRMVFPTLLIVIGLYLVLKRSGILPNTYRKNQPNETTTEK